MIMSGLTWIVTFICAAGCHLSSSSPVPRSPLVVHRGQNVSLTCNITSSLASDIIWYQLRSDQLLPLLSCSKSRIENKLVSSFYSERSGRMHLTEDPNSGLIRLEVLEVEEQDTGLYFCSSGCGAAMCVNEGIHLKVTGDNEDSADETNQQPCYSSGFWVLPALLGLCLVVMAGFYLSSAKQVCCCCNPASRASRCEVAEEESLHYSSLRHPDRPGPIGRDRPRLIEDLITYSAVTGRKNFTGSQNQI